jgi:type IV pilus assembly protein PilY1
LIQALQSILLQIRAERFAAGAPIILPMGEDNELFAASYSINRFKQWEGTFHKYIIAADESESLEWMAEQKMIANSAGRKVYTSLGMEGNTGASVAELRTIAPEVFQSLAGVTSRQMDFRDWLIAYPQEPGVLGDMEHSSFAMAAAPKLSTIPDRAPRIYLQTNRGVLHALDRDNGEEKWAFIPPNIFQARLRNQKFSSLDGSWYLGDGTTGIRSTPLVLLDGMISANDFKIGNDSKTFIVGNLGWGGNGFYAMDVTEPGAEPRFLWAVENARYSDQETVPLAGVKLWGAAANNRDAHDYSDLGLTISATEIRNSAEYDAIEGKWRLRDGVGILAGGLGYKSGADSQGKVFYFFDPNNASIIRKITSSRGFLAPSGTVLGMGIAPIYYIPRKGKVVSEDVATSSTDRSVVTKEFFTGDSEGNVLYCDMTEDPSTWDLKSIFQVRTLAESHPVAITKAFEVWGDGTNRWLFGGTSDLMVPGHRTLSNGVQFIFALNLKENQNLGDSPPSPPVSLTLTTGNLVRLTYLSDDIFPAYQEPGSPVTAPANAKGWFLKLRPKIVHDTEPTEAEYVTTAPFFYQGAIYVSTFVARTRQPDDDEKCPELGDGKLYAFDPMTGGPIWSGGQQALVFNNIKIAGISAVGGRLFLGIKVLQGGALDGLHRHADLDGFKTYAEGTTIAMKAPGDPPSGVGDPSVPYDIPILHYWKERF